MDRERERIGIALPESIRAARADPVSRVFIFVKALRMIEKTIKFFLPRDLSDKVERRHARKAIVSALAILIWAPVFGPAYYFLGSPRGGIIIGVAAGTLMLAMSTLR